VLPQGTVVAGYRIEKPLGQGGMGVVYEATQLSLNRTVALKFLAAHFSQDVDFRERFRREGVIQAGIDHPHIVPVYEAGDVDDGLFLAMRLIRGSNLKELILGGDVDAARTMRILAPVAEALAVAHEAGLTHRDIKPQNILVGARDHSYLADFGLTKGPDVVSLTRTGQFLGTLDYVAPETINGQRATDRSDTYALAAVLYECLTGEVPYKRPSEAAVLFAHVSDPPPVVSERRPDLPAGLDDVIARGMAKQPEERYASPIELMDDAGQALAAGPATGAPAAPPPPVDLRAPSAQPSPPPAPTTVASHDAIAPTVPSDHRLDAVPQEAVAEATLPESTAVVTPPDGTAVLPDAEEPAATTELELAPPAESLPSGEPTAPETPAVSDSLPTADNPAVTDSLPTADTPAVTDSLPTADTPAVTDSLPSSDTPPVTDSLPSIDTPPVTDWGLEADGSGTVFDWGRGERATEPLAEAPPPPAEPTPPAPPEPRSGRSRWPLAAGAVALLVLAVAAAIVIGGGGGGGGGGAQPPAPTPAAPEQATASDIGLRHPATWQPTDAGADALPGTDAKWPIALAPPGAPEGTRVLAGRLPSEGPTLLPNDLIASLPAEPPAPTPVRLGQVDAYRYTGLAPRGSDRRAEVYVIPTSSGVVTLACVAPGTPPAAFSADCERIVESLAISSGDVYPLGPDRQFAKRLNGAMRTLNARRATLRKRLRSEQRAAGQADIATDLARAFTIAAGSVAAGRASPAVAPDRAAIVKAMRRIATRYRALAKAANRNDGRAYKRARTDVGRAEAGVRGALRHLDRRSYTVG
jgi:serine/threonine protein kinase